LKPLFLDEFPKDFDSQNSHQDGDYNYRRPQANAMLGYDALKALLTGCKLVLKHMKPDSHWSLDQLQPALLQINVATSSDPDQMLQGITGQIRFTPAGDAADKTVLVLCVTRGSANNKSGFTKLVGIYNQFLVGGPNLSKTYSIDSCKT
jgi:ABC-type branched-subunit amino acid transport system substrate-binding protein